MSRRVIALFVSFLLAQSMMGYADDATQLEEERLLATDKKWAAVAAAGDVKQVLAAWSDDAVVYFPGRPKAVGKEAIRRMVLENRALPGFSLVWSPSDAKVAPHSRDIGHTHGTFEMSVNGPDGNAIVKQGYYVCIWKRQQDASWKCIVEISNVQADDFIKTN